MLSCLFLLGRNISEITRVGTGQWLKRNTEVCEIPWLVTHGWLLDEQSSWCKLKSKPRAARDSIHVALVAWNANFHFLLCMCVNSLKELRSSLLSLLSDKQQLVVTAKSSKLFPH